MGSAINNHPIGSIYHLYTTYSPCQWGDYMLPTTYYQNQETPLIICYLPILGVHIYIYIYTYPLPGFPTEGGMTIPNMNYRRWWKPRLTPMPAVHSPRHRRGVPFRLEDFSTGNQPVFFWDFLTHRIHVWCI